jgi:hypothetical protein
LFQLSDDLLPIPSVGLLEAGDALLH